MIVLQATNLTKVYGGKKGTLAATALDSVSLSVSHGEFIGIMGPSGSGKTTLLQLLGTIDAPTCGEILVAGQQLADLKENALALFRRRRLGFIFQDYNMIDSLTLMENIMVPLVLEKLPADEIKHKVRALAERLGIASVLGQYPYEVSGGQKQRAAAARALVHVPALVLADEPTGNLDSKSARDLMESLEDLNKHDQATIVMVTHDPVAASHCSRILFLKDGRIVTELRREGDRQRFFQVILDMLAETGGDPHDGVYARR